MPNTLVGNIRGPAGVTPFTSNTAPFTVPAVGLTVDVPVLDASWVVVGAMLSIANAGGGGLGANMRVTAKTGNTLTLLNP